MADINFQPVFDYIDNVKKELRDELIADVRQEMNEVKTSISNLSQQVKKYHEEMLVSGHRIDRLESWAEQVGKKVGVPIVF